MNTPPQKPYMVGVSGGSASGKSYLRNRLMNHFGEDKITLISQDNYYRSLDELAEDKDGDYNWDIPDAVRLDDLAADLKKICQGETVLVKEYTFNNLSRLPRMLEHCPAPIVLVEGLFVFYHPAIAKQLNLKLFVEADEHVKVFRRIHRDGTERGYDLTQVTRYYQKYVVPGYRQFVEPTRENCDLIIPNNTKMETGIQVIIHHLEKTIF